jgi:hypothetical protein
MSWLIRGGDVLAAIQDRPGRQFEGIEGALLLERPALVHAWKSPVSLDVAWCARVTLDDGTPGIGVRRISTVKPRRVALPDPRFKVVVVASGGSFERWRLQVGDRLEIKRV